MFNWTLSTFVVSLMASALAACSVDATENSSDTESEVDETSEALSAATGGGGRGVAPRKCLKCEGCSTSRGWNACCSIIEVDCSLVRK